MTPLSKEADSAAFCKRFGVPPIALEVLHQIVSPLEQQVVLALEEPFTAGDVRRALSEAKGRPVAPGEAEAFARAAYRRGVFTLLEEEPPLYGISDFYGRLDIFAISELDTSRSLPRATQLALDNWYFIAYCGGLDPDRDTPPTEDTVLPADEIVQRIQNDPRQLYLAPCDCRSLAGLCEKPLTTCLSWRGGLNTFAHRGHSRPVSKQEGIEVVLQAEKDGLMHTINPGGICNCCGDCCYLFRAREKRESGKQWPVAKYSIHLNEEKCVACGKCVQRCHFGVFAKHEAIQTDTGRCVGCGICATACPTKALALQPL